MARNFFKNVGALLLFTVIFAAVIVYLPIGVFLFAPLSFLKGYLVQEEKPSFRAFLLLLNFIFLFATILSLILIIKPASLVEGVDELTFLFGLYIFLYQFFDVIIFWAGMSVRNKKIQKNSKDITK